MAASMFYLVPRTSMSNRHGILRRVERWGLGGLLSASGGGSSHRERESATERYAMRPHCTKGEKGRKIRTKIHCNTILSNSSNY